MKIENELFCKKTKIFILIRISSSFLKNNDVTKFFVYDFHFNSHFVMNFDE